MLRYLAIPAIVIASTVPSHSQTIDITGSQTVLDQLTPPGGRCVPPNANTVIYGPGDIRSDGTTNLGPITEAANFCITNLPPPNSIVDGSFTIAFRAGDTITGSLNGRVDTTATAGVFSSTKNLTITGGTGRFTGASGSIEELGALSMALGVGTYNGSLKGQIVTAGSTSTGNFALAEGGGAAALGDFATAYGGLAIASGERTLALGSLSEATAPGAVAVGDQAVASGASATALGQLAEATAPGASALGHNSDAFGIASTAVGVRAVASGLGSTALGRLAAASGANATALGSSAMATFAGSTSVGFNASTTAANQVALGGSGSSVRIGDIAASTAAQSGPLAVATVDANGTVGRNTTLLSSVAALQTASTSQLAAIDSLNGSVAMLFDLRARDRDDFKKGIAASTAMGQASFPSAPGKTSYALNGAVFRGEAAVGGSLMHRFDSDTPIALGIGFSFAGKKNNAFRAGVAGEF